MFKKFKRWLYEVFLPTALKDSLLKENDRLREKNRELSREIKQLNAYIAGMNATMRAGRKIVINNEVSR